MDWQIRIALIIVGIAVIGFIIFDFNRRKKAQVEKERLIEKMRQAAEEVDAAGFDFTGVTSARPAKKPGLESSSNGDKSESELPINDPVIAEPSIDTELSESAGSHTNTTEYSAVDETISEVDVQVEQSEVDQSEIVQSKINSINAEPNSKHIALNQSERKTKSSPTEQLSLQTEPVPPQPELVFSLILQAESGSSFQGKDFMPLVLSQGLRHGDMGIFHRHSGIGGKPGPVMYSVANALKPGTFELKNIERFETPAFAFFMTYPGPTDAVAAFEAMVKTIKLFKQELGGQILDDSKSVYTEQTYQHQLETLKSHILKASLHQS